MDLLDDDDTNNHDRFELMVMKYQNDYKPRK